MNNNFGLSDRTINDLKKYFTQNSNIEKVLIYGSRAKGTYHTGSDIDFAIWTNAHDKISEILNDLDELPTPYKFNVIDYKMLSHDGLKNSIDTDGILFFEKK